MKKTLIWSSLALLLLVNTAWPQSGGNEQAVAQLEQKWLQSQRANNPDMMAPHIAEKAVFTEADGRSMNKAEFLKEQKATKYSSVEYINVKVTDYGSAAIATAEFKAKGTDPAGKSFDVNERYTDSWVKMPGGKWQCVASHSSTIKK